MKKVLFTYGVILSVFLSNNLKADDELKGLTLFRADLLLRGTEGHCKDNGFEILQNDEFQIVNFNKAKVKLAFVDDKNTIAKIITIPVSVQSKFPISYKFYEKNLNDNCGSFLIDNLQNKPISSIFGTYSTSASISSSSASFKEAFNQKSQVRIFDMSLYTEGSFLPWWIFENSKGNIVILPPDEVEKKSNVYTVTNGVEKPSPEYVRMSDIQDLVLK